MEEQKYKVQRKNKIIGLFLISAPLIGLMAILVLYALASSLFSKGESATAFERTPVAYAKSLDANNEVAKKNLIANDAEASNVTNLIAQLMNIGLSVVGVMFILGIFIGIPMGLYFLTKKESARKEDNQKKEGL